MTSKQAFAIPIPKDISQTNTITVAVYRVLCLLKKCFMMDGQFERMMRPIRLKSITEAPTHIDPHQQVHRLPAHIIYPGGKANVQSSSSWKFAVRYMALVGPSHLGWEIVQLPLYTLWNNADTSTIAYAIGHCTLGDLLIATTTLFAGFVVSSWISAPANRYFVTGLVTIIFGVSYTIFSEWLNTVVLRSWEYSHLMPQILGIGLSPVVQWIAIPVLAFVTLRRQEFLGT